MLWRMRLRAPLPLPWLPPPALPALSKPALGREANTSVKRIESEEKTVSLLFSSKSNIMNVQRSAQNEALYSTEEQMCRFTSNVNPQSWNPRNDRFGQTDDASRPRLALRGRVKELVRRHRMCDQLRANNSYFEFGNI
ncbi:MAG: hypothetical protein CUN54_09535 [Phototrophicales bacterium]|nr:MAG: hypothetical protein CUN54_09535 [Phototrophicales bacterium]